MTLKEFFDLLGDNPILILGYFLLVPFTAALVLLLGRGEGHLSPWKYLYSSLIYAVCVPAIFSVTLSIYFFLFERRSILDTDLYTQIVPIISMVATLLLINKNTPLKQIPGFDRISGLMLMITAAFAFMWFIDKTRILVFTSVPFYYVLVGFILLLVAMRFGWSRIFKSDHRQYEDF